MPLHESIQDIYQHTSDPLYIIRLFDYLISKKHNRTTFILNDVTVQPMLTGILENPTSKERYYSISEFYYAITGKPVAINDISILKEIIVIPGHSVCRVLSSFKEDDIIGFFDQKYRTLLLHRDLKKRIKHYTGAEPSSSHIKLFWDNNEYQINIRHIQCNDAVNPYTYLDFLDSYEDGVCTGLVYCDNNGAHFPISEY